MVVREKGKGTRKEEGEQWAERATSSTAMTRTSRSKQIQTRHHPSAHRSRGPIQPHAYSCVFPWSDIFTAENEFVPSSHQS